MGTAPKIPIIYHYITVLQHPILSIPIKVVKKVEERGEDYINYLCTFEPSKGKRITLSVPRSAFKELSEGDLGTLTYRGTKYLGFRWAPK